MTSFRVPEVVCDGCERSEQADGDESLGDLRRRLRADGWCVHRSEEGYQLDFCEIDGHCPWHSSVEAFLGCWEGARFVPAPREWPIEGVKFVGDQS